MKKTIMIAVALGIVGSGAAYYVWCSLQWKENAEKASAEVESEPAAYEEVASEDSPDSPEVVPASSTVTPRTAQQTPVQKDPNTTMEEKGALTVQARMGQGAVLAGRDNTVHMLLTAKGAVDAVVDQAPVNLVLVIDRSGSMKGERMDNARSAAGFLVDQLKLGDRVSVVSYNTEATADQASVVVTASNKPTIKKAIQNIKVRGDTCVSCGLSLASQQMLVGRSAFANDISSSPVSRLVLLSDGKPTAGVRDAGALAAQAQSIRELGATVTTIGVGLDYNEELMSNIALKANGNHHFVEHASALSTTLQKELTSLRNVVARNTVADFQLSPGVRLVKVFDRRSNTTTRGFNVDLGDISADAEGTVLVELNISPNFVEGVQPVATVSLSYEEASTRALKNITDTLEVGVVNDSGRVVGSRDVEVEARVEQARIREALQLANAQLRTGNVEQARQIIDKQKQETNSWMNRDRRRKHSSRAQSNLDVLERASGNLNKPAVATKAGKKRAAKAAEADAFGLAL